MTIRSIGSTGAVARLNALRFKVPVPEVAALLAEWEASQNNLLVPIPIELERLPTSADRSGTSAEAFKDRAAQARKQIASKLGLGPRDASRLTFMMSSRDAWFLGPRPNLNVETMRAAAQAKPELFIELMLQRELLEGAATIDPTHTFVTGGFGPGVYLCSLSRDLKNRLHLMEAQFEVKPKHGQLLCEVTAQTFVKKKAVPSGSQSSATLAAEVGGGFMVGVTRVRPADYIKFDGRHHPIDGISLDILKIRQTRMYYLNVLTEFARKLFAKASVPVEPETFVATNCVDDGYIKLDPIARLLRPLTVVNVSGKPMDPSAFQTLRQLAKFAPDSGLEGSLESVDSAPAVRRVDQVPEQLSAQKNYLFLNGNSDDEEGSVRVWKGDPPGDVKATDPYSAYAALAAGGVTTDPYTTAKFRHLMNCETVSLVTQGLDLNPQDLSGLQQGPSADGGDRALREKLKRCLIELSLKECLLGYKTVPAPSLSVFPDRLELALIATRHIRFRGKQPAKQLVSCVEVTVGSGEISVARVRRSPWAQDTLAALAFAREFPFLWPEGKEKVVDGQFWVVDRSTGERLIPWKGPFVPKIILNHVYQGIEAALGAQEETLERNRRHGSRGHYYSKGREFNLLPYYMSMYLPEHQSHGERTGTRIALQDCGAFVRVFVPPAGGIVGSGDALSGMRDVMLYSPDGHIVESALLEHRLVQVFLHTLTNGVLVAGDNSKMSLLEKLATLALEN